MIIPQICARGIFFCLAIPFCLPIQADDAADLLVRGEARLKRGDHLGAIDDLTNVLKLDPKNSKALVLRGKAKSAMKLEIYAFSDFADAIEHDPSNLEAYRRRGGLQAYAQIGNRDQGIADLTRAIDGGFEVPDALADRGFSKFYQGDLVGGVEDATLAMERGNGPSNYYFNRSQCLFGLGDMTGTVEDLDRDIASDPTFGASYLYRGCANLMLGLKSKADSDFAEYLKFRPEQQLRVDQQIEIAKILLQEPQPESAKDFVARAQLLRAGGNTNECTSDCSRAIAIDPQCVDALRLRSTTRQDLYFYTSAIEDLSAAIEVEPKNDDLYYRRSHVYYLTDQFDLALSDCGKSLELDPRQFDAMNLMGLTEFALEKYDASTETLSKLIAMNPSASANRHSNLALACYENGDYRRAVDACTKAASLEPTSSEHLMDRARSYGALGEFDKALKDIERAIQLTPSSYLAYERRALIYLRMKDWERALADLDKTLELTPYYTGVFRMRSLVFEMKGDLDSAITAVEEATKWNSRATESILTLGLLKLRKGDSEAGRAAIDKVVKLQPQSKSRSLKLAEMVKTTTVTEALFPVAPDKSKNDAVSTLVAPEVPKGISDAALKSYEAGLALREQAKYQDADAAFRKAITLAPRFGLAHLNRGLCFLQLGRNQEAERSFAECLRIDPSLKEFLEQQRSQAKR